MTGLVIRISGVDHLRLILLNTNNWETFKDFPEAHHHQKSIFGMFATWAREQFKPLAMDPVRTPEENVCMFLAHHAGNNVNGTQDYEQIRPIVKPLAEYIPYVQDRQQV